MTDGSTTAPSSEAMAAENLRLRRAVEELSMLNDLAREISASPDIDKIMNVIVRRSLAAVHGRQGVLTLVARSANDEGGTLVRTRASSSEQQAFHVCDSLLGWMMTRKQVLTLNAPRTDGRFKGVHWDDSIQSLICAPLLVKSELVGVLTVYNKRSGQSFSEEDARLLSIVAAQSAQVVENARLLKEEQALLRMREELRLAAQIQLDLLPGEPPDLPGYGIVGLNTPAQEVGGDYFDFIRRDERRLIIGLGDVSGKGLPAALLMSNLQAAVRAHAFADSTPKECMERTNRLLHRCTEPGKFATFFCALLDAGTHDLTYCNAGHDRPLYVPYGGAPTPVEPAGLVLSFFEDAVYEEGHLTLAPGDRLVIYSDGITEAMDGDDEMFGEERLVELVASSATTTAADLADEVLGAVREHRGTCSQSDDITLVVVQRDRR